VEVNDMKTLMTKETILDVGNTLDSYNTYTGWCSGTLYVSLISGLLPDFISQPRFFSMDARQIWEEACE